MKYRSMRSEVRFHHSDFGLPTSDFGLPTSDFGLPTSDFGLPTSDLLFSRILKSLSSETIVLLSFPRLSISISTRSPSFNHSQHSSGHLICPFHSALKNNRFRRFRSRSHRREKDQRHKMLFQ